MKKVYIASDHGGFELKQQLIEVLSAEHEVEDLGSSTLEPADDYPDYGILLGEKVVADTGSLGIALCRNGQGICVAANKVRGIRAVTGLTPEQAVTTRVDDDANIVCFAADYQSLADIQTMIEAWLAAPRSDAERHVRRRGKIADYESQR